VLRLSALGDFISERLAPALRAMLALKSRQEPFAFLAALFLDAQLLIALEALRMELPVPIFRQSHATTAAMVLMAPLAGALDLNPELRKQP
jgi:uncharacterized membrane-anchored protein